MLHEVIYWLVAGILNVRAERAIAWPEKQEIGELKLNFVRVSPRIENYKKAIISASPLLVGLLVTWHVANNIFQITSVVQTMSSGALVDVGKAVTQLTSTPDFWLWFYVLFTVTNTMFPTISKDLYGWKTVVGIVVVILLSLGIVGVSSNVVADVTVPIGNFLTALLEILIFMLGINLIMVMFLGTIEYTIERISGNSATFRKGKMITMTRAEALQEREKDRERERRRVTSKPQRNLAADLGIPTIYRLPFPVPSAPTKEATAQIGLSLANDNKPLVASTPIITQPTQTEEIKPTTPQPIFGGAAALRANPAPITQPEKSPEKPIEPSIASRPPLSFTPPSTKPEVAENKPEAPKPAPFTPQNAKPEVAESKPEAPKPTLSAFAPPKPSIAPKPLDEELDDDDDDDDQPITPPPLVSSPSRFGVSPFGKPTTPTPKPSSDTGDEKDESLLKPATPKNPLYSNLATIPKPSPFGKPATPAPKPISTDDDADDMLANLMRDEEDDDGEDLRYERDDEDYYDDEDDEAYDDSDDD